QAAADAILRGKALHDAAGRDGVVQQSIGRGIGVIEQAANGISADSFGVLGDGAAAIGGDGAATGDVGVVNGERAAVERLQDAVVNEPDRSCPRVKVESAEALNGLNDSIVDKGAGRGY